MCVFFRYFSVFFLICIQKLEHRPVTWGGLILDPLEIVDFCPFYWSACRIKNVISFNGFGQFLKISKFSVPAAPEVGLFASGRLVVEVAVCQARKLRRIEKCEMCGVTYLRLYEPRVNLFRRDKSGESWNDAWRWIVPRGSFEILRSRLIDMKLKLGQHLERQAT